MKKMTQWLALTSITALCLTGSVFAQEQGGPGENRGERGGGRMQGGGDPAEFRAQMEQRMLDNTRERLEITDDTEWKAVEPLVKKVNELRAQQLGGMMRGAFGRGNRGGQGGQGGQGGRGGFGGEASPEQTALSEAVEANASKEDLKAKMAAFRKARDQKAAELKSAQENLKKVLTTKQEAVALQMGLIS
jgi:hypothetical protein